MLSFEGLDYLTRP